MSLLRRRHGSPSTMMPKMIQCVDGFVLTFGRLRTIYIADTAVNALLFHFAPYVTTSVRSPLYARSCRTCPPVPDARWHPSVPPIHLNSIVDGDGRVIRSSLAGRNPTWMSPPSHAHSYLTTATTGTHRNVSQRHTTATIDQKHQARLSSSLPSCMSVCRVSSHTSFVDRRNCRRLPHACSRSCASLSHVRCVFFLPARASAGFCARIRNDERARSTCRQSSSNESTLFTLTLEFSVKRHHVIKCDQPLQ